MAQTREDKLPPRPPGTLAELLQWLLSVWKYLRRLEERIQALEDE